jgi:prepilin-type processing-associated H-X9-DG protein
MGWSLGNTLLPPNPKYPNCSTSSGSSNTLEDPGMVGLSSLHLHPGGANLLRCDGSVRFFKDSTARKVVWALGARQVELISADAC